MIFYIIDINSEEILNIVQQINNTIIIYYFFGLKIKINLKNQS